MANENNFAVVSLRELGNIQPPIKECQNYFIEMNILLVPIRSTVDHIGTDVLLSLTA